MKNTDRLIFLMEEIAHLEKQLQPHDTGHIHTAISVLRRRVQDVKSEIDPKYLVFKCIQLLNFVKPYVYGARGRT